MRALLRASIKNHFRYLLLLFVTLGSYLSVVFSKMLTMKASGLFAGHENVWSDWSLHIAMANIFAFKSPTYWLSYHPLYADGKFTYPFLTNFLSGMLMRLGMSLEQSFSLPSIALTFILLAGLYFLFYLLTGSKKLAVVAVFVFFLSAGPGFINFFKDLWRNPSFSFLLYPLQDYGRYALYQWYASNIAVGLLVPQRASLIGVTLGVWAVIGVLSVTLRDAKPERSVKIKILVIAGIFAGILPIAHAHSFIAVVTITGLLCLFHYKKWRLLWYYILTTGVISSILYLTFIWGGVENSSFTQWHPGFSAQGDFFDWLRMWILLWGVMLPVAAYGLYFFRKSFDRSRWAIYIAGVVLFAAGNLFYFQPIAWDNSKIFLWAYLIFSALAALVLGDIWAGRHFSFKTIAVILFATLTLTGFFELVRLVQTGKHELLMTSTDDIQLGLEIRQKTDPFAVFLTAPSHNHFVMMWGLRPILMGFTAWVWNYGFNYYPREADMKKMFLGGDGTEDLIKKYKISYVVIGPSEVWDLHANEDYFRAYFPVAFRNSNYRIYDTRTVWSSPI